MKKIYRICTSLCLFVFVIFAMSFTVTAAEMFGGVLDIGGHLTQAENERVTQKAQEAARKTGMNIIIYICDDVGYDKTDYGVMDHADVMYESICGINTDGILLLINLDNKYDYISTSGSAINYFSDRRIDMMFDWFTDDIIDENYERACTRFIDSVLYYYDQGKANNQTEIAGVEVDPDNFFSAFFVTLIIAVIVGACIFIGKKNMYKLQRAATDRYIVSGSLLLNQSTDTYIGTVVNRIYSPQSSGGGSGGHSSGHSSTHHSSGGGRHGGGGHHR